MCSEFEEITEKALTTPADTKELMELKAYVDEVESHTIYILERRLMESRTTLAFLIEYVNISTLEMRCNANTFAWYDRMQDVFDEHRAIVTEKQIQFEDALKVCFHVLRFTVYG